jgi:hypothetical protein
MPFSPPGGDPVSAVVSQLAVLGIQTRLASNKDVSCEVSSLEPAEVLMGKVGPIKVKGRDWRSQGGLTFRSVEASVEQCAIDLNRILTRQEILLTTPAKGKVMVAFSGLDVGNFLAHRFMSPPNFDGSPIRFLKEEEAHVDAAAGIVSAIATYKGRRYRGYLSRGTSSTTKVVCCVESHRDDDNTISQQLGEHLTKFFNEHVIELDGTFLKIRDMMVADKGGSPCVMLSLDMKTHRFPSLDFTF